MRERTGEEGSLGEVEFIAWGGLRSCKEDHRSFNQQHATIARLLSGEGQGGEGESSSEVAMG